MAVCLLSATADTAIDAGTTIDAGTAGTVAVCLIIATDEMVAKYSSSIVEVITITVCA